MIKLYNTSLPNTIKVQGREFLIKTDFRYWLLFDEITRRPYRLKDISFLFVNEVPNCDFTQALLDFFKNPNSTPRKSNKKSEDVLDYQEDGEFIYASFMNAYGIDLLDKHLTMHWHQFKALVIGLPNGTIMSEIMSIRVWNPDNRKINDIYKEQKRIWSLPNNNTNKEEILREQKEFFG